jgi:hypothetical protein
MPITTLDNGLKCGCVPSRPMALARRPYLAYYLRNVPPGPATCQRTAGFTDWGMKLNDRYGCCVVSGWAHMKQAQSYLDGEGLNDIPDSEVQRIYLMLSPRDQGLNIDDFLEWTTRQKMPWQGGPHGVIDPNDRETLKKSIWWLGGVKLGIGVPREWGSNVRNGFTWDRVGHFEGVVHDVQAVDYNERGLEIITWGAKGTITWAGMTEQCGEAHAVLAPDWYGKDSKAKAIGIDVEQLKRYLDEITGQISPDPEPSPNPQPGPNPDPFPGPEPDPQPTPDPGPSPDPSPNPDPTPCPYFDRGLAVFNRGVELAKKNPNDPRLATAIDWLEGWFRND